MTPAGFFIDANLLVLLVVGSVDRERFPLCCIAEPELQPLTWEMIRKPSASRRKSLHITALRLIYLNPTFWRNYMAIRKMGNNFRHDALDTTITRSKSSPSASHCP